MVAHCGSAVSSLLRPPSYKETRKWVRRQGGFNYGLLDTIDCYLTLGPLNFSRAPIRMLPSCKSTNMHPVSIVLVRRVGCLCIPFQQETMSICKFSS